MQQRRVTFPAAGEASATATGIQQPLPASAAPAPVPALLQPGVGYPSGAGLQQNGLLDVDRGSAPAKVESTPQLLPIPEKPPPVVPASAPAPAAAPPPVYTGVVHLAAHNAKEVERGCFPAGPFRTAVLSIGTILLVLALILRYTGWREPTQPILTCYKETQLQVNGVPIDICLERTTASGGTNCGEPAADAWCVLQGSLYAWNWTISTAIVNTTLALGNNAYGGQNTFDSVCCDARQYWPTPPRWLLYTSGLLLLYLVALALAKLLLLLVEVVLVGLVATEALYFYQGLEGIMKYVIFSIGLVVWTGQVFWVIWCGGDRARECDEMWLNNPLILQRVAMCFMSFQLGRLGARLIGKAFAFSFFFKNQLPKLRRILHQERLLAAMSTPSWARALLKAQAEASAAAALASSQHIQDSPFAPANNLDEPDGGSGGGGGAAGGTTATTTGPFAAVANGEPLNDATGKATADGRTTAAGGAAAQGSVDGRSSSEAAKAAPAVPAQAAETPLLAAGVVEAQPAVTHFSGASVISYIKDEKLNELKQMVPAPVQRAAAAIGQRLERMQAIRLRKAASGMSPAASTRPSQDISLQGGSVRPRKSLNLGTASSAGSPSAAGLTRASGSLPEVNKSAGAVVPQPTGVQPPPPIPPLPPSATSGVQQQQLQQPASSLHWEYNELATIASESVGGSTTAGDDQLSTTGAQATLRIAAGAAAGASSRASSTDTPPVPGAGRDAGGVGGQAAVGVVETPQVATRMRRLASAAAAMATGGSASDQRDQRSEQHGSRSEQQEVVGPEDIELGLQGNKKETSGAGPHLASVAEERSPEKAAIPAAGGVKASTIDLTARAGDPGSVGSTGGAGGAGDKEAGGAAAHPPLLMPGGVEDTEAARQLNAELVAVEVGTIGALRKFRLFVAKYADMDDKTLERECKSLAARLFQNLRAYLATATATAQAQATARLVTGMVSKRERAGALSKLGRRSVNGGDSPLKTESTPVVDYWARTTFGGGAGAGGGGSSTSQQNVSAPPRIPKSLSAGRADSPEPWQLGSAHEEDHQQLQQQGQAGVSGAAYSTAPQLQGLHLDRDMRGAGGGFAGASAADGGSTGTASGAPASGSAPGGPQFGGPLLGPSRFAPQHAANQQQQGQEQRRVLGRHTASAEQLHSLGTASTPQMVLGAIASAFTPASGLPQQMHQGGPAALGASLGHSPGESAAAVSHPLTAPQLHHPSAPPHSQSMSQLPAAFARLFGASGREQHGIGSTKKAHAGSARVVMGPGMGPADGDHKEGGASSQDGNGGQRADRFTPPPDEPAIAYVDFEATLRSAMNRSGSHSLSRAATSALLDAAKDAWQMFDKSNDSWLTEADVRTTLEEVYRGRRNLARSVRANMAVCASLEGAAGFIIHTALIFVYMAIFGINIAFSSGLDFFKTYVLAFSFIFGDSLKQLFQSAIFLLVEHPFDVGDTLQISDKQWTVEKFDLMYSTLVSGAGELATVSNTSLMSTQLINVTRSKRKSESMKIRVPTSMPLTVITAITARMKQVYEASPTEYVEGSPSCSISEWETSQTMVLAASWAYTFPPAESSRMSKAGGAMKKAVLEVLREEGVPAIPLQLDFMLASVKTKKD